jgi:hypothetical protein
LENWFVNSKKSIVTREEKQELSRTTSLTCKQVSFWIHNRRKKEKLKNKEFIKRRYRLGKHKNILINYFNEKSESPSEFEICLLSSQTGFSKKKIKYWFEQKKKAKLNMNISNF